MLNYSLLFSAAKASVVKVVGVKDTSVAFLQYLEKINIGLGTQLEIEDRFEFDESTQIKINDNNSINISKTVSNKLYVEKQS